MSHLYIGSHVGVVGSVRYEELHILVLNLRRRRSDQFIGPHVAS